MMKSHRVYNIPNLLTAINLASGCCGIMCIFYAEYYVILFLGLSLLMDFLDGMVARLMGITNTIGRELDSLADVVSFGVVPTAMMFKVMISVFFTLDSHPFFSNVLIAMPSLLIAIFSALRLAKFNQDTRDPSYFYGLNTPTNTIFVYGIFWFFILMNIDIPDESKMLYYGIFIVIILMQCFLMVSDLKMFSNKADIRKPINWGSMLSIVSVSLVSFYFCGWIALSIGVLMYVLMSIVLLNLIKSKHKSI